MDEFEEVMPRRALGSGHWDKRLNCQWLIITMIVRWNGL